MKKFGKFLFGTITLASIAAGAYYVYKNYIKKDSSDDFDDFEDDFEDFDMEDEETEETRGYVPINLTSEESQEPEAAVSTPAEEISEDEDLH